MKKIFLLTYVISVFFFSIFAKAEIPVSALPISSIKYNEGSWLLNIRGALSTPCLSTPKAVLTPAAKSSRTLILKITAEQTAEVCAQVVGGRYDLTLDLRSVIAESGVEIERGLTYKVRAENYPFEVSFDGRDVINSPVVSTLSVQGTLVADSAGRVAVVTADNSVFPIGTSFVNLEKHLNRLVSVIGLYVPLQGANDTFPTTTATAAPSLNRPQMVVTGISSAAL